MKLSSCCYPLQQRLLCPTFVSCSLLTSTCRRINTFRSVPEVGCTQRRAVMSRVRNALECSSRRVPSEFTFGRKVEHYLSPSLKGVSCIATHLLGSLRGSTYMAASLHTWSILMASKKDGKDTRSKGKASKQTHGSVLMDMIKSEDQQPKQLTVGAKGEACEFFYSRSSHRYRYVVCPVLYLH